MSQTKKTVEEKRALSTPVLESDAQLLLNLSNAPPARRNEHFSENIPSKGMTLHKNEHIPKREPVPTSTKFQNQIISSNIIIMNDEPITVKHKLPIPVPIARNKFGMSEMSKRAKLTENKPLQEQMHVISVEDYDLLKIIKAKGLTRRDLCELTPQSNNVFGNDVNNNNERNSSLIDHSYENNSGGFKLDDETRNYNQLIAFKLSEAINKNEETGHGKSVRSKYGNKISMTNIIYNVLSNIGETYRFSNIKIRLNEATQTNIINTRDVACSTADESDNKGEKLPGTAFTLPNNNDNNGKNKKFLKVIENQVNGAQTQPTNIAEMQQLPQVHYIEKVSTSTNDGNYPNCRMKSALELTEPSYQHFYTNNNIWKSSCDTIGIGTTIDQQQSCLPTAATATVAGTASLPVQQSPGLNTQASTTNVARPTYTPINQTCPENPWRYMTNQNQDNAAQQKNRHIKNTPLRNTSPEIAGHRFQPPFQGKYHSMIEQQRLRAIAEQAQNYPNTVWDYTYKRN